MLDYLRQFLRGVLGFPPEEDLTTTGSNEQVISPRVPTHSGQSPKQPKKTAPNQTESATEAGETETSATFGSTPEDASELPPSYKEAPLPPIGIQQVRAISFHRSTPLTSSRFLWCIDNGHGSLQKGKRSPVWEDRTQLLEWEFNRQIVQLILKKLDTHGIAYFEVVPEKEVDAFLKERVQRANEKKPDGDKPKIYVSIHGNSAGASEVQGVETWYHKNSTSGKRIASVFQRQLMQQLQASSYKGADRGIRCLQPVSKSFYVLHYTAMPAIVTENGFYSNEEECRLMLTPEFQELIAEAHVAAILEIESNGYDNQEIYGLNTKIVL